MSEEDDCGYAGYESISMRSMVISNQTLSVQGRLIACAESIVKCVIQQLPMYRAAERIQIGQQDKQARISRNYKSLESAENTAG